MLGQVILCSFWELFIIIKTFAGQISILSQKLYQKSLFSLKIYRKSLAEMQVEFSNGTPYMSSVAPFNGVPLVYIFWNLLPPNVPEPQPPSSFSWSLDLYELHILICTALLNSFVIASLSVQSSFSPCLRFLTSATTLFLSEHSSALCCRIINTAQMSEER